MTNQEQDIKIAQTKQEVDDFKATIENFIQEMRDRDNKRDADIRELRQKREEDNARHKEEMKEISQKIDNTIKHIQGLTIASMVGIGAIAVSVIVFVGNSIFNPPQPQYYYPPPAQTQTAQIQR